jgi:hypothetical protein
MDCPPAQMSANDVITLQLNALQHNRKNKDDGIKQAYFFASVSNKQHTGPYTNLKKMIKSDYKPILNFKNGNF